MADNDAFIIDTILSYCDDVQSAIKRFSLNEQKITEDYDYRALLAFFIQQIGENASKLSDDFKTTHPEIEWKAIIGLRHHIVHAYGRIIPAILWDSATDDVPELATYCRRILGK